MGLQTKPKRIMETTNVNLWAMYSEIEHAIEIYNMGFLTRADFADYCFAARDPYISRFKNYVLYLRDRYF